MTSALCLFDCLALIGLAGNTAVLGGQDLADPATGAGEVTLAACDGGHLLLRQFDQASRVLGQGGQFGGAQAVAILGIFPGSDDVDCVHEIKFLCLNVFDCFCVTSFCYCVGHSMPCFGRGGDGLHNNTLVFVRTGCKYIELL